MSGSKHTMTELQQLQALPLIVKIEKTKQRIREWVERYGEDGVYISFSGGKDSTVLMHLARSMFPDLKAAYFDTGLEYPEIRQFVKTFNNVDWLKPKLTFKQVIEKYGYPMISKEVSECVQGARRWVRERGGMNTSIENLRAQVNMLDKSRGGIMSVKSSRRINMENEKYLPTQYREKRFKVLDYLSMINPSPGGVIISIVNSGALENIHRRSQKKMIIQKVRPPTNAVVFHVTGINSS